jgi:hypothetical protein
VPYGKIACLEEYNSQFYGENITDSMGACVMTNIFTSIVHKCGCLPYNMVEKIVKKAGEGEENFSENIFAKVSDTICTFLKNEQCAKKILLDLHTASEGCNQPCHSAEYDPTVGWIENYIFFVIIICRCSWECCRRRSSKNASMNRNNFRHPNNC